MLIDELKTKQIQARKSGDKEAVRLLSLVLGDVSTLKSRTGKDPDDSQIETLIRSLFNKNADVLAGKDIDDEIEKVKGNEQRVKELQTLKEQRLTDRSEAFDKLRKENDFFKTLLPATLTVEEIKTALLVIGPAEIRAAKSSGQATGVAMKILRAKGLKVLGDDVKMAVEDLRR